MLLKGACSLTGKTVVAVLVQSCLLLAPVSKWSTEAIGMKIKWKYMSMLYIWTNKSFHVNHVDMGSCKHYASAFALEVFLNFYLIIFRLEM